MARDVQVLDPDPRADRKMTAVLDKACRPVNRDGDLLRGIDRDPLRIGAGIGAPLAHRLLESVWRKALWLMRDGKATTAEMEVVIRTGLGLRWSWPHRTGGKTGCRRNPPGPSLPPTSRRC